MFNTKLSSAIFIIIIIIIIPDLVLISSDKNVYILELTVGFESNLKNNSDRKADKYNPLVKELSRNYRKVKFVNVSMSALGILGASCDSLLEMLKELYPDERIQRQMIKKTMNIAIRCTYFIFCCRNKAWTTPDLMDF